MAKPTVAAPPPSNTVGALSRTRRVLQVTGTTVFVVALFTILWGLDAAITADLRKITFSDSFWNPPRPELGRRVVSLVFFFIAMAGWTHTKQFRRRLLNRIGIDANVLVSAVEKTSNGVLIADARGTILWVNKAFSDITGYTEEEAVGRQSQILDRRNPRHYSFSEDLWAAIDSGQSWRAEIVETRKDRSSYTQELNITPVRNSRGYTANLVIIMQDITRKQRANLDLTRSVERAELQAEVLRSKAEILEIVLEHIPHFVFWKNQDSLYLGCNSNFAHAAGFENPEAVIGKTDFDFPWTEDEAKQYRLDDRRTMDSGTPLVNVEETQLRADGRQEWILTSKVPLRDEQGDVFGILGMYQDITEAKEAREKLRVAMDAAHEASDSKGRFLATISHELRTPLTGILGMTEALLESDLNADQIDSAETVRSCADSLLTLINDILDYSKLEAGQIEFDPIEFDVEDICDEVLQIIAFNAHNQGIDLASHIDPRIAGRLMGDSFRIRQVLTNLVNNAVKFTEVGGVYIFLSLKDTAEKSQTLRFEVRDTGIGIPESRMQRLFKVFSQVDRSTSRHYGGTGLGLAICKQLIEGMGGCIGVESEENEGSTFWFELTLPVIQSQRVGWEGPPTDILVVNPEPTSRHILASQVAGLGLGVSTVSDLEEAQQKIESHSIHFVLTEESYGEAATDHFAQSLPSDSETAVVLMSRGQNRRHHESLATSGYFDVLKKPLRSRSLLKTLARYWDFEPPSQQTSSLEVDETVAKAKPLRILVAEDNRVNQKVISRILEKLGDQVVIAETGKAALEEVQKQAFDVVLMDCQMPEMNGFEASQEIRGLEGAYATLPIFAMTANALPGDRERCLQAGMSDYLTKPIDVNKLKRVLNRLRNEPSIQPSA